MKGRNMTKEEFLEIAFKFQKSRANRWKARANSHKFRKQNYRKALLKISRLPELTIQEAKIIADNALRMNQ